jgi:hypothetical protein
MAGSLDAEIIDFRVARYPVNADSQCPAEYQPSIPFLDFPQWDGFFEVSPLFAVAKSTIWPMLFPSRAPRRRSSRRIAGRCRPALTVRRDGRIPTLAAGREEEASRPPYLRSGPR